MNANSVLNNKKPLCLLIGADFQNFCTEIKRSLEKDFGFEVTFIEEVQNNFLIRLFVRLRLHFIISPFIKAYENIIWKKILGIRFDVVLVINPECLSKEFYTRIYEEQEDSIHIMYFWDTFATKPRIKYYLNIFKENYTFDRLDAEQYAIKHLPLFFTTSFMKGVAKAFDNRNENPENSKRICFIGTAHTDRVKFLSRTRESLPAGYTLDLHLFIPHRFLYLPNLLKNLHSYVSLKQLPTLRRMSQYEVGYHFANADIVLDFQKPMQTGVSARSIETYAARSFLCTTNESIRCEPILGEENYYGVLDRNKPLGRQIKDYYESANPSFDHVNKFSVKAWLGLLLGK